MPRLRKAASAACWRRASSAGGQVGEPGGERLEAGPRPPVAALAPKLVERPRSAIAPRCMRDRRQCTKARKSANSICCAARGEGYRYAMTTELTVLAWGCVLAFVHIFAAVRAKTRQYGTKWNIGARDEELPPLNPVAGRLARAQANYLRDLPDHGRGDPDRQRRRSGDALDRARRPGSGSARGSSICRSTPSACRSCAPSSGRRAWSASSWCSGRRSRRCSERVEHGAAVLQQCRPGMPDNACAGRRPFERAHVGAAGAVEPEVEHGRVGADGGAFGAGGLTQVASSVAASGASAASAGSAARPGAKPPLSINGAISKDSNVMLVPLRRVGGN